MHRYTPVRNLFRETCSLSCRFVGSRVIAVFFFSFEICPAQIVARIVQVRTLTHTPNKRRTEKEEPSNFQLELDKTTGHIICQELNILRLSGNYFIWFYTLIRVFVCFFFFHSAKRLLVGTPLLYSVVFALGEDRSLVELNLVRRYSSCCFPSRQEFNG